jgi:hypothetical protein
LDVGTIKVEYARIKNVRKVRVSKKQVAKEDDEISDIDEEDLRDRRNADPIDEKAKKAQFGLSAG